MKPINQIEDTWHCDYMNSHGGLRVEAFKLLTPDMTRNVYLVKILNYDCFLRQRELGNTNQIVL